MAIYAAYSGSPDTGREPSSLIWKDCPWSAINTGHTRGIAFFDDFLCQELIASGGAAVAYAGNYQTYLASGTVMADLGIQGGGISFTEATNNEGFVMSSAQGMVQISNSMKKLWFEARVKFATVTDVWGGFVGLLEPGAAAAAVPIATDGTLADKNLIGFHRLEGDGDRFDLVYKADGQTAQTLLADAVTLVADTWIKVGFVFDPSEDPLKRIKFYYNAVEIGTYATSTQLAAATFPSDITLSLAFGGMGTGTGVAQSIDWWRLAQLL